MAHRSRLLAGIVSVGLLSGACTLENPEPPMITGPSTLALSLSAAASPDILPEDGVSQSVIRITARDQNGQPAANVPLRVDTVDGGAIVDFGTLSARNVTTNASGEATVVFTAPKSPFVGVDTGNVASIAVRQIGTDYFGTSFGTTTYIRLVPESVATIPGAPVPNFYFAPASPKVGDRVFFDASASTDDGAIVRYRWNYGDGEFEEGVTNTKDYTAAGTYFVTLTVTDNQGNSSSLTRSITVTGS